jgi:hypothetical protein
MKKISTLFVRDPEDRRHVLPEVTPGCEWVLAGEGRPTRKWDGTCVMLDEDDVWWARREVKPGKKAPDDYVPISFDEATGKTVGWEPIEQSSFVKWHEDALKSAGLMQPGTYELAGPKVNGNPEMFSGHNLIGHGWAPQSEQVEFESAPRDYDGLRAWLLTRPYEGIVWHHPDGRMVKLKKKDFA